MDFSWLLRERTIYNNKLKVVKIVNKCYQKVGYIGLRNADGSYMLGVPLYVKLNSLNSNGVAVQQEEIIHRISEVMMKHYEHQISEQIISIQNKKKLLGETNNEH